MPISHSHNTLHINFDFDPDTFIQSALAAISIVLLVLLVVAGGQYWRNERKIAPPTKVEASAQALLPLGMNAEGDIAPLLSGATLFDSLGDNQPPDYIPSPD